MSTAVMDEEVAGSEDVEQELQPELDEREEAIANLCRKVEDRLSNADVSELDVLHEVGCDIINARSEELYGPYITKEVAKRLNTYRQKVQFSVRFAEAFDEAGLDELRDMKTAEDKPYVWSSTHIRFLLRVKNDSERMALAKECARADWPCRRLQSEVKPSSSAAKASKGPGADLTSAAKAVLQFFQQWGDFVQLHGSPNTNLLDKMKALDGKKLSEKQRSLLSSIASVSNAFTEHVVQMNAYIHEIHLGD